MFCCNIRLTILNYKDHYWKHLNGTVDAYDRKVPCPKCTSSFTSLQSFETHFKKQHSEFAVGFIIPFTEKVNQRTRSNKSSLPDFDEVLAASINNNLQNQQQIRNFLNSNQVIYLNHINFSIYEYDKVDIFSPITNFLI